MNATETALAKKGDDLKRDAMDILSEDELYKQAQVLAATGAFPDAKSAGLALAKVQLGATIGLAPPLAMASIDFVQGKPFIGSEILAGKIKESGKYNYKVVEISNTSCEIEFFEKLDDEWESTGKSAYSMADAELAGLKAKDNYRKTPRNMLFARAMSNGQRWYCPDVLNGATVYTLEERDLMRQEQAVEPEIAVELVTEEQAKTLRQLIHDRVTTAERQQMIDVAYGTDMEALTQEQAAELFVQLEGMIVEDAISAEEMAEATKGGKA